MLEQADLGFQGPSIAHSVQGTANSQKPNSLVRPQVGKQTRDQHQRMAWAQETEARDNIQARRSQQSSAPRWQEPRATNSDTLHTHPESLLDRFHLRGLLLSALEGGKERHPTVLELHSERERIQPSASDYFQF